MQLNKEFDVIIFGFGLVAKLFLCSVSKLNLKIGIINRKFNNNNKSEVKRGIALNHSSCEFFKTTDILRKIRLSGNKIDRIQVLEKNSISKVDLDARNIRAAFLSYVIEESHLEKIFLDEVSYKNIYFLNNYVIDKMRKEDEKWVLIIKNKKKYAKVKTNLIVGIDGANSFLRNFFKIDKEIYDYKSSAFVFNSIIKKKNINTAFQKVFNRGIIAALPIKHNIMKVVITASQSEANYLKSVNQPQLKIYLQHLLEEHIGEVHKVTKPLNYKLLGIKSREIIKKGLVLLGNAAITLNPITAQGFNLSIKDVEQTVKIIKRSVINRSLKLSYKDLLYYQLKRRHEHDIVIKNINLIFYFFKTNYFIASKWRKLAFIILDNSAYMKRRFILNKQGVIID